MIINQLIDEDFVNYKKASMYIGFPKCDFKCERECGMRVCQNGLLAMSPTKEIDTLLLTSRYMSNFITSAIVIAGLEPFDTWDQLVDLVKEFRQRTEDDIVIYTGYYKDEIKDYIKQLKDYVNIMIKFGRYIPSQQPHYDEVLGVNLASDNQHAEKIS
jgi:pyruvate-formate lyase-activating enzyme